MDDIKCQHYEQRGGTAEHQSLNLQKMFNNFRCASHLGEEEYIL